MYYDKWNDRNRRAHQKGEKDAEWGYMTCYHYDRYSECGAAYEDGYYTKRREVERRQEEQEHQERCEARRRAEERELKQMREAEEEYYREQEAEHERYREILFRKFT